MTLDSLALLGLAVALGAATQRLTGMGFALVAAPLLVTVVGPLLGVQLLQVVGIVGSALVLAQVWRDVEPAKAALLLLPALLGILPGAWLARSLPGPLLTVLIGAMVIVALVASLASERARVFRGRGGLVSAGALSGFMNVTAGVGGPAVALYALSTDWAHRSFVATLQLYFIGLSTASLVALGWPTLDPGTWAVTLAAVLLGLGVGHVLTGRVTDRVARGLMIAVALAGASVNVARGVHALVTGGA